MHMLEFFFPARCSGLLMYCGGLGGCWRCGSLSLAGGVPSPVWVGKEVDSVDHDFGLGLLGLHGGGGVVDSVEGSLEGFLVFKDVGGPFPSRRG